MGTTRKVAKVAKETRGEAIRRIVAEEFAKGTTLPAIRRLLASVLGGNAKGTDYLGTADPAYYRLLGLSTPLATASGKPLSNPSPKTLRDAVLRRRDAGVRWEVLAASTEAVLGRKVARAEVEALYVKAGGDLDSSYAGRGTRVGAPKTYGDGTAAIEATLPAEVEAKPKRKRAAKK